MPYQIGWLIVLTATLIMEAVTAGLVTIWFSAGAFAALAASFLGAGLYTQIAVFLAVSAILLVFTRPIVSKKLLVKKQCTNADKLVGERAVVCEEINVLEGRGQVKVHGQIWSARSPGEEVILNGETVIVRKISGVNLIVEKI